MMTSAEYTALADRLEAEGKMRPFDIALIRAWAAVLAKQEARA